MPISKHRVLAVFLLLAWGGSAAAESASGMSQEEELAMIYGDASTISLATGSKQSLSRAPSVATVITSQHIAAMGATDLDQVLARVPGLHVSMNNVALKPIYSFRGIHTKDNPQVLMLVNGVPLANAFAGDRGQLWGGMPLENVARIEVIRGPGSALYGADAFSGTINVITKTAADSQGTEFGLRAGSFNSGDVWIQHGGQLGAVDAAFYLSASNSDGQKGVVRQDAQTAWDRVFGTRVSNAPGSIDAQRKALDANADLSLDAWRLRAGYLQREMGMGGGLGGSLDPNARGQSSRLNLDLSYEQADWAPNWDVSGLLGFMDIREQPRTNYILFPAGAFNNAFPNGMIGNPAHAERHTHGSVTASYKGYDQHQMRIGAGHRVEDLYRVSESKNFNAVFAPLPAIVDATGNPALVFMLPHKRNLSYAFVQDEWNFTRDWTLTAGVRHDRYSDFGGTTNPRLALVWDAAYNLTVKAMHGTAFRAPSFAEMYSINNPVVTGNANVKPETISTDELAFVWQPNDKLQTNLNFFSYRMRNIIQPVGVTYQNSGDQTGRGLELEATLAPISSLHLTGNYSLQHSTNVLAGQDAGMAPHQRLYAQADWRFAALWQLDATANHVAGRMREPGDTRAPVPDYTLVNLTLKREQVIGDWDVRTTVSNLFNRQAWEPTFLSSGMPSDLPLPGRAIYVQLQLKL